MVDLKPSKFRQVLMRAQEFVLAITILLFRSIRTEDFKEKAFAFKDYVNYLTGFSKNKNIDTLALGCSHFPLISENIQNLIGNQVMILDSGEGMSKGTIKQIFKPFFTTKGERGSGLGLSTSYEIIKKHKGELEVQSMLGTGTTFVIFLPLPKKGSKPLKKNPLIKKIMLVDDEEAYRKATAELLSLEGYEVEQASDGYEALEKLKKSRFDLILSDISMPKLSGHDLVQKVKSEYKNTKVILISGFNEKLNQEMMESLNVDGWLTKPCLFEDISEAIKKTCH